MTAITLSNINKRFGEKVLFRDYSLHIEAGEFVAIKGESGAGKTTLLNIIGLLETPDSGSVTLCGARNPSFSSRAAVHLRRHKLSYLFQNYGLVDTDTVEANMKLATRFGKAKGKAEKERIADALLELCAEKPFPDISISEITDRADVGRATYYRHFSSKEDVIAFKFKMIFESLPGPDPR